MRKSKLFIRLGRCIKFVFLVILFTCGIVKANAAESFPSTIQASLDGVAYAYSGGPHVYKKNYTSSVANGKVFCTLFKKSGPSGKCSTIDWNSNATTNKKIAAAIGTMIAEARNQSSDSGGGIDWQTYVYAEMAINNFLYLNNGKKADNNVAAVYTSSGRWAKITSDKRYKAIYSAGEAVYKNYGKARVEYSNPKITLDSNRQKVTATVDLKCYDDTGKLTSCAAKVKGALTITGETTNGQNINTTAATGTFTKQSNVYHLTYTYTLQNDTFKASDDNNKYYITGSFDTYHNTTYHTAQNYNCSSTTQTLTPNLLVDVKEPTKHAKASAKTYYKENEQPVECDLTINKFANDGATKLKGAVFELYSDSAMQSVVSTGTTDNNGQAKFLHLSEGTYYIKETQAPSGYAIPAQYANGSTVELSQSGSCINASLSVQNDPATGSLSIKKIDENNQFVKGAKIKVYSIISDNGNSENLEIGETTPGEETEETDGPSEADLNKKYKIEYLKFDANGNYSPNGEYDYFISNGAVNTISGLPLGNTYYVSEEAVPENSDYAMKIHEDSVTIEESKNYDIILVNNHSNFKISKQSITSTKELPGAQLEIFFDNGLSTGYKWTSTDKPQEILRLADGNYTLTETTAPQGYTVAESINFTIENGKLKDDSDNTLVMKDATIVDVPDTLSVQNIITMFAGLLLVGLGSGVLFYEAKRKKKA